jgi:hypothetical protein
MNVENQLPEETTVIMDFKEYANMRDYCRLKRQTFKVRFEKENRIAFTANTLFLAIAGFLDF